MNTTEDQFCGALVGLALGDALGAPYEGGPVARLLWHWIGSTREGLRRYTDDTQTALDLAASLSAKGAVHQDDLALRLARSYRWDRGYGPGAAKILRQVGAGRPWREASRAVYPAGSFGNGAAMRSPVIGLFYAARPDELPHAARLAAEVTHAHVLGMEGAALIASATAAALDGSEGLALFDRAAPGATSAPYAPRLAAARRWLEWGHPATPRDVRSTLGMGITAPLSCVTALYLAARFMGEPLARLLAFAAKAGGDVDTVSAMAAAIWGARHGLANLPAELIRRVEGVASVQEAATLLYTRAAELQAGSLEQSSDPADSAALRRLAP